MVQLSRKRSMCNNLKRKTLESHRDNMKKPKIEQQEVNVGIKKVNRKQ